MSHSPDGNSPDKSEHDESEEDSVREIERVRELLGRTVRFLSRCTEDPRAAMDSEDPRDLIRGLEALAAGPEPAREPEIEDSKAPIQIRRRRSA